MLQKDPQDRNKTHINLRLINIYCKLCVLCISCVHATLISNVVQVVSLSRITISYTTCLQCLNLWANFNLSHMNRAHVL